MALPFVSVEALPTPTPPIVVEYLHTAEESVRANAAVTKMRSLGFITLYLVLGTIILVIWWTDEPTRRSTLHPWILGTGLTLLTFPVWRPALMRFLIKRQHAKLATANKPVRWTFMPECIHVKTAVSEARIEWAAILRARELRDGFVLWTNPRIGHWLPKHGFKSDSDIESLRALIEQRGIKFKRFA